MVRFGNIYMGGWVVDSFVRLVPFLTIVRSILSIFGLKIFQRKKNKGFTFLLSMVYASKVKSFIFYVVQK